MTHDSYESKLRSVLQLMGTYTTLIAAIFTFCIIISNCFVVIYCIFVSPHPNIIGHGCYIVLGIINIICVGVFLYKGVPDIKKLKSGNETALSEVAILSFIVVCVSVICYVVAGNSTEFGSLDFGSLDFDSVNGNVWGLKFSILLAPVLEEISFRVLCIGVPVFFIALIRKKRDARLPLRKCLAGGFEINKSALFFIFLSSFGFGASHIPYWGMWKFYPAFISGLVLGYLFVKYGLYVSMSAHFLINYLPMGSWLLWSRVGVAAVNVANLLLCVVMIACIPCIYLYIKKKGAILFKNFTKRKKQLIV